ncbi:ankyrin repeat domain-containing protein SOWAHC-like [Seriola lalandi dorsalis]|uniref:Sosondowah ankyrin repeat domain family Cb n=1 Tax=Seriola lalandi dorsalis TaxID=1841481 RepID=A0A3B4Y1X3_SERLL|nr:ankyrin repeat domain-containing protein SOWAHC-like [Seriola lalandi dorsalis]
MEFSQEAIVEFVRERGGRVRNSDLTEHFKAAFPEEQEGKAASRERFKDYVDNVAFVKAENGVKYVCLRFRGSFRERRSNGTEAGAEQVFNESKGARGAQAAEQQTLPGSGYGSDSQVRAPPAPPPPPPPDTTPEFVCTVEEAEADGRSGEMGNTGSFRREKRESEKEQAGEAPVIPEISVIEASPLPAEASVFALPGPVQTGGTGQVDAGTPTGERSEAGTHPVIRRRGSKGSRPREPESDDEGSFDTRSLCGSDGTSSRKHFIQVMMNTSPQVRRSMVFRRSAHLSSRSDSDSASLVSTNLDDDGTSVTLDPLEHEWMMCASDAEWGSLRRLLNTEPSLVLRKDFVTGFTCLHWAAKHGKPELIALIVNFAKQRDVPISVDVRSNAGYTPLHIAAMHDHMEVVKLLVGAYCADPEIRDYSGRKACQYLTDSVSLDIRDIVGAYERSDSENVDHEDGGRWRFSKVLQSNLKPLRLLNPADCDSVDGEGRAREKPLRRRSSLSRMKPKLEKLRSRTSQIVHSTSFRGTEDLQGSARGSFRARPKTHFFG